MERYICIHGHFYQPPRENPWLNAIELQDSAYPYHDWNERITAECYAPNAVSRILGGDGRIVEIVNNYSKISFNFGPTLLSWLEEQAPETYQAILEADRASQQRYSGHGSALAQAYNHMIVPLANQRDKRTQVIWGIRDFEHRFGRKPEGMWLPETSVDLESLEVLSEQGIVFTVLAPHQAARVRSLGSAAWEDVAGGKIDPTRAYLQRLPSGRTIVLFFYDEPISRSVAFEGLLSKGEDFAQRLLGSFSEERDWPQLLHVATDGETYGHHHRHGDMALAYALHYIEANGLARLTNYGEYLEKHPPSHEVEILEDTSWSCAHGVERWRSDCGCNTGARRGWNQAWRAPLRQVLDLLRDDLAPKYEAMARPLLKDPWAARDDYIAVVLDRRRENVDQFLRRHAIRGLSEAEKVTVLKLLELQRHTMLMYTSCGWFFDDLSGIETAQVIQYAGRAVQLGEELFGDAMEERFLACLEQAKSNIPAHRDGRRIYDKFVRPAMVDLAKVGAHYALSSLFEEYGDEARVYSYTVQRQDYRSLQAGAAKVALGRARVTSEGTGEAVDLSFGVLHFGDHNLSGGVRPFPGEEAYQTIIQEVSQVFASADLPEVIRLLDEHFEGATYSLRSLFRDEQRKIQGLILESSLAEAETLYRQLYEHHGLIVRVLVELGMPLPRAFQAALEVVLNGNLRQAFREEEVDSDYVRAQLEEAQATRCELDGAGLGYTLEQTIDGLMERFSSRPEDLTLLDRLSSLVRLASSLPFDVDLWKAQNAYYRMLHAVYPDYRKRAEKGDETAQAWVGQFIPLGETLSFHIE